MFGDGDVIEPRLRLIASDNRPVRYTPHILRGTAFDDAIAQLRARSCGRAPCGEFSVSRDALGPFLALAPPLPTRR